MRHRRKLFISYRRDDSWAAAGWLLNRLMMHFPPSQLFLDTVGIKAGERFPARLIVELKQAAALIVIIGLHWHTARLGEPDDYVCREIAVALADGIVVLPVLVDGASPPNKATLPEKIHALADLQCHKLERSSFEADVESLIPRLHYALNVANTGVPFDQTAVISGEDAPGNIFKDLPYGPHMVVIPAGNFLVGSPIDESDRDDDEGPQRLITFECPIAVGRFPVTRQEWGVFLAKETRQEPHNRAQEPASNLSWFDAKSYVNWLKNETGEPYRLLSESEWEYAVRAGSQAAYGWGRTAMDLRGEGLGGEEKGGRGKGIGKARQPNPWGIYTSNIWEWVEDTWHDSHELTPTDGTPFVGENRARRILRGGMQDLDPRGGRVASRNWENAVRKSGSIGFRVARNLRS